jgi:hypothetical protein
MIREMHLISDTMLEADINLKWTSTLSNNPKGNQRIPDRGLVRH